ncbi:MULTISPECIES: hypothetical protein [unclassified Synechococcus]|uniref:hypothetical protein n=1 Tax=unclassified Synechococcus TaxID=2626047 RepID=UPI001C24E0AE|nr:MULTISPECIES: hypothetical protein [unclassified Synechococcus]
MARLATNVRQWLARRLRAAAAALWQEPSPPPLAVSSPPLAPAPVRPPAPPAPPAPPVDRVASLCPGVREPLSVETAVLSRDMTVLKREAADSLAALGAAHALISSARLAQVQELRPRVIEGQASGESLMALAAEYQGWQGDQVRIFDALALVMRMGVPKGLVLDQLDPGLQEQARSHLEALSVEYQRRLLAEQFHTSA